VYDIAIIGAGPAGATLARLVGADHKTILIDRRRLAEGPHSPRDVKSCGGLLAPDAQKMLARLSLGLPAAVLTGPQVFAVRAVDLRTGVQRMYQRHYINIERGRFDRWLVSLVDPTVDIRHGRTVRRLAQDGKGVTIDMTAGGRTETVRARLLVGADGAASTVRRHFAARRPAPQRYVSIQETLPAAAPQPHFAAYFDSRITDYYAWSIPKDGTLLLGAAIPAGHGARQRFERLKATLLAAGLVTAAAPVARSGSIILRPTRTAHLCPVAGPAVLIGEAAGWISPSSAEGISYAFRSALAAAQALDAGAAGFARRYRHATKDIARDIALKNLKRRLIYTPAVRRLAMRIGCGAMVVTDPHRKSTAKTSIGPGSTGKPLCDATVPDSSV